MRDLKPPVAGGPWTGQPGLIKALGENECSSGTLAKSGNLIRNHTLREAKETCLEPSESSQ